MKDFLSTVYESKTYDSPTHKNEEGYFSNGGKFYYPAMQYDGYFVYDHQIDSTKAVYKWTGTYPILGGNEWIFEVKDGTEIYMSCPQGKHWHTWYM